LGLFKLIRSQYCEYCEQIRSECRPDPLHFVNLVESQSRVSRRLSSARKKNDARAGQLLLGTCDGFPRAKPRFGGVRSCHQQYANCCTKRVE
jgi:hypothetical protein